VQRPDAHVFRPHAEADPEFAQVLRQALMTGVAVLACRCRVSEKEIAIDAFIPVKVG